MTGPEDVSTRAELGQLLTELRQRAGLSLRQVAERVGSSPSTISGWCRAKNLPFPAQTPVFAAMLEELGVEDTAPWLETLGRLRPSATPEGQAPYRGLEAFGWDDSDLFFGREELVDRVIHRLAEVEWDAARPRLVLVVGASGVGKSSLLHAGLWTRMVASGRRCLAVTPSDLTVEGLAARVAALRSEPPGGHRPVVLLDQLEEAFTSLSDSQCEQVLDELASLAGDVAGGTSVVAAVRSDLLGELAASSRFDAAIEAGQVLVGPMRTEELRRAIVEPARAAGVSVDDELVDLLVGSFAPDGRMGGEAQDGALPLLSHALLEAWSCSSGVRLTVADYLATSGVDGAVERSAEAVFDTFDTTERDVARQLFLRLVHVGDGPVVTRRPTTYVELDGLAPDQPEALESVLDRFIDARLVTAGSEHVQIAHDALLRAWPRLSDWVEQAREGLLFQRRVTDAARIWLDRGRDPSALAGGALLDDWRNWAQDESGQLQLNDLEREFLEESVAEADAQAAAERQRNRRLRRFATISAAAGIAALVLAMAAIDARTDALTARDQALSRQVAITADRLSESDPLLAAQLAVAGYEVAATSEARSAVLDAAAGPSGGRWVGGPGSSAVVVGEDSDLVAMSDSSDASVQLFAGAGDGLDRVGRLSLEPSEVAIFALALAPDEATLAVGDATGEVTLWDVSDPAAATRLAGPLHVLDNPVQELTFTDGGDTLAVAGAGPGLLRFDVTDPSTPAPLPELDWAPVVWSVTAEQGGGLLAFGAEDGNVQLWDQGSPADEPVAELEFGDADVFDVSLADDGQLLAASSRGGEVGVWELADPGAPERIELADPAFDTWVNAVAISDDGAWLAAGSSNGNVRVWSTETWTPVTTLDHPAAVTGLVFADDTTLLSTAVDGTLRRWQLDDGFSASLGAAIWNLQFDQHGRMFGFTTQDTGRWDRPDDAGSTGGRILQVSDDIERFSGAGAATADGSVLAQGRRGGEVLLYDATADGTPQRLESHLAGAGELIERLEFSPTGEWLATIGEHTHLWQLDDGRPPAGGISPVMPDAELADPSEGLFNLAWSPAGELLAVASADGHIYLYAIGDAGQPTELVAELEGLGTDAYAVAFHPEQPLLAGAGTEGHVRLWDIADPAEAHLVGEPIVGPPGRIFDVAFDTTGQRLAAAAVDGGTWVWTLGEDHTTERYATLDTGGAAVYSIAFAPDQPLLVAGASDGSLHAWRFDTPSAVNQICDALGDTITHDEWERYLPDRTYDPPCEEPS